MTTTADHHEVPAAPSDIRFEHHLPGALGIGERAPRLSWQVPHAPRGWSQRRYEVRRVVRWADGSTAGPQTLVVESGEQVLVPWPFADLASRDEVSVEVRVQGDGAWSAWSAPATVEVGLLQRADWVAQLVGPSWPEDPDSDRRPPLLRTEFAAGAPVTRARLYVTAHGLAELELNGRRVSEDALVPGWSSYHHRLRYHTYDVTALVGEGPNVIGAWLADGWFRGRIGFEGGTRNIYGDELGLLAQLEITMADGTRTVVATGPDWKAWFGPILSTGLYEGEIYDDRLLPLGWSTPAFGDAGWFPVHVQPFDTGVLAAPDGAPVRCTGELAPVTITARERGRFVVDFGQNHSGRLRLRTAAAAGATVVLRHAEVLEDGELCTRPLRGAAATDIVTLGDQPPEHWEPRFTIHGYRYAEISGWPGPLTADDVVSRVLHTDMPPTGDFWCSEPDVQRLHDNVVWSTRSNFVDIPTDCPQRDERLGWTGDIQVFAPAATFLFDVAGFLGGWLRDVAAEQADHGTVPWYVPFVPGGWWDPTVPGAVWGDVAVLTPWTLYERYGDRDLLARQYASAKAWVDQVDHLAGEDNLWDSGLQLGDWLDPAAPPDRPGEARTDPYLVATAYFARSAGRLADIAAVLRRADDAARYADLAGRVRRAFAARYLDADGGATSDTQTAYALAIVFDLFPDERARERGGDRLAELVNRSGGTIGTGFAGTPVVCDALTRTGHLEEAYRLLLERRCPSWLYPVTMGATTIWERWDSLLPDGTVNPGDMTSFNHYALGAVADWLHRVVAGLAPEDPAYRTIRFAPRPGGGLTRAGARHRTPYGEASIDWSRQPGHILLSVVVPVGARGIVDLPGQAPLHVSHGEHTMRLAEDLSVLDVPA